MRKNTARVKIRVQNYLMQCSRCSFENCAVNVSVDENCAT